MSLLAIESVTDQHPTLPLALLLFEPILVGLKQDELSVAPQQPKSLSTQCDAPRKKSIQSKEPPKNWQFAFL